MLRAKATVLQQHDAAARGSQHTNWMIKNFEDAQT